jgi:hypothetical protein
MHHAGTDGVRVCAMHCSRLCFKSTPPCVAGMQASRQQAWTMRRLPTPQLQLLQLGSPMARTSSDAAVRVDKRAISRVSAAGVWLAAQTVAPAATCPGTRWAVKQASAAAMRPASASVEADGRCQHQRSPLPCKQRGQHQQQRPCAARMEMAQQIPTAWSAAQHQELLQRQSASGGTAV